jgi:hypothetical protein
MNKIDLIINALEYASQFAYDITTKESIHGIDEALAAARSLRELKPVAWIEHEWSGTGVTHLHFDQRKPTLRDEVLNPVWTPLYALEVLK